MQGVQVIVVDNASEDGSVEAVHARYPWVTLIRNDHNLGYARANNQAFEQSVGDWVLLLNPDAELTPGALSALIAVAESHPDAGAVTGKLVDEEGREQSYMRAFPDLRHMLLCYTFLRRLFPRAAGRAMRRYFMLDEDFTAVRTVPQPPGACLMVRRSVVGNQLMDERFPLFFNDVDLCRRIWDSGYGIYYTPYALIRHVPNRGGIRRAGALLEIEHAISMMRYFNKHHPAWEYVVVRAALVLHYTVALIASWVKPLMGKRPSPVYNRPSLARLKILLRLVRCRSFFDDGDPRWT